MLKGRYTIIRTVQVGGMGAVYQGLDLHLGNSPCAIKQMLPQTAAQEGYFRQRFEAEMRTLMTLAHRGIPKIADFFKDELGHFMVMEFIDGVTVAEELWNRRCENQPLAPAREVVLDVLEVLDVLASMHQKVPPVIHRDIKPANLIRERTSRRLRVVDFGLACWENPDGRGRESKVGTPGYRAPELAGAGGADARSDLFSVGITFREMLTGLRPKEWNPQALQAVAPTLAALILELTNPDQNRRPSSAAAVTTILSDWLENPSSVDVIVPNIQTVSRPMPPAQMLVQEHTIAVSRPSVNKRFPPVVGLLVGAIIGAMVLVVVRLYAAPHFPWNAPAPSSANSSTQ